MMDGRQLRLCTALVLWVGAALTAAEPILRVSGDGHYLTKNGSPFFWLGDTGWSIVNLYSLEEIEYYFDRRAKQGFNVINMMFVFNGGPGLKTRVENDRQELPFLNMNPATPNDAYFRRVDDIVRLAQKKGLILYIMPCGGSGGSFVSRSRVITKDNARAYAKWVGERYKDYPNIVWVNGFDLKPWDFEEIGYEVAGGLREGDRGAHLITYHPSGGNSSSFFHHRSWLAFNVIQTWADYLKIYSMVYSDFMRTPTKPVILVEGAYEEGPEYPTKPITPLIVRKQAYWAVLAGSAGHTYGHNDIWRKNPNWRESLESPGARHMKVLKDVFSSRKWWRYVPDQSVFLLGANGGAEMNTASRSLDGDGVIVYLSSPTRISIDMTKITAGRSVRVKWVNTETGAETAVGEVSNLGSRAFTTPEGRPDAVLLLESR
jgi:hypothetical protein